MSAALESNRTTEGEMIMNTTPAAAPVAALSLSGILMAQPFGLSVETIIVGSAFSLIGVIGRAAFEMQKAAEAPGGMKLSKVAGWVGAGFIGSPFASILYLIGLKLAGVQSDSLAIIGLLFFGFTGPKGVTWLINNAQKALAARFGLKANDQ
jgi:hypothetical protein